MGLYDIGTSTTLESNKSQTILEGEQCKAFVPGITAGWEIVEKAAEEEGLI